VLGGGETRESKDSKREGRPPEAGDGVAVADEHACNAAGVKVPYDNPSVGAAHGDERAAAIGRTAARGRVAILQGVLDDLWELILERILGVEEEEENLENVR